MTPSDRTDAPATGGVAADHAFPNGRQRFLAACRREPLDRPPVWCMNQAGRYLPEHRELGDKHGHLDMVKTPEIACELTLQPVRRFGMDAAILFSDILVICAAMGPDYAFRKQGGIAMAYAVDSREAIDALDGNDIRERLQYVADAHRLVRGELGDSTALIGFTGSPWTLASYMVEGGSSNSYTKVKTLFHAERELFDALAEKLTGAIIDYLHMQIDAGVDAVQIFDSLGSVLCHRSYWYASGQWIERIVAAIQDRVPVIVFAGGAHHWTADLLRTRASVLGLDWTIPISRFHDNLGGIRAVQGNLDPALLCTTPEIVQKEVERLLADFGRRKGHIVNLGDGITPDGRIDCLERLVATVQGWKGQSS